MVHGFKNFACFAHHTTTFDGLELSNPEPLLAPAGQVEPGTDTASLLGESTVSMKSYSFGKVVKGAELGEVLHEIPDRVLCDHALSHAMGPPALLIEFGQLYAFREPNS